MAWHNGSAMAAIPKRLVETSFNYCTWQLGFGSYQFCFCWEWNKAFDTIELITRQVYNLLQNLRTNRSWISELKERFCQKVCKNGKNMVITYL